LITEGFPEESICVFHGSRAKAGWRSKLRAGPDLTTRGGCWGAALAVAVLATLGALVGLASAAAAHTVLPMGAGLGACFLGLLGALWMAAGLPWQARMRRNRLAGREILLVLQLYPADAQAAVGLLRDAGSTHVEQAVGSWRIGHWDSSPGRRAMAAPGRVGPPPMRHRTQWQP
jgi:hypothetical protein